ncbi:hypothetical protein C0J50_23272, partial [Silurus asotus]
ITMRYDFNSSLLFLCLRFFVNKLQLVQNAAARVPTRSIKYDHITPILSLLTRYNPSCFLRSQNSGLLVVPRITKSTKGGRSFSHLAPKLWNSHPDSVQGSDTLTQFKCRLKTYLF